MRDDETDERERTDEEPPPELRTKPDPRAAFDDEPKSGTFRIPRI